MSAVERPAEARAQRTSPFAPFRVRSFRYQWPADLATSWSFEMENLILGWYVLVETRSVVMLTIYASMQYLGTLLAPMLGVAGDRIGQRNLLSAMRAWYTTLAATLMILAYTGALTPLLVMFLAALMGLVRPSDIGMRTALVGETIPSGQLVGAMGIQRTTQDSARIAGALTGAGLVAAFGMGPAYTVVTALYLSSFLLTLRAGARRRAREPRPGAPLPSPLRDLKEGFAYVLKTPHLLAVMCLALLLNFCAFPVFNGLMPYVAKEVYHADQTVLGWLTASGATGALLGSLLMSRHAAAVRPARMMVIFSACWYAMLLAFAHTLHPEQGMPVLALAGIAQALGQVPMAAMLLQGSEARFRGRVMGIRMLALYANLPGLLLAGQLIPAIGYAYTATLYSLFGIGATVAIAVGWRSHLWRTGAPSNAR